MLEVKKAEAKLIEDLKKFKVETRKSLDDIRYGISFALKFLNQAEENNKTLNLFSDLYEFIGNFTIDSFPIENGTQTLDFHCKIGSDRYSYREGITDESLTEKRFIYLLMLWQMEVNNFLSRIEAKNENNFDAFCYRIRVKLRTIIENYIESSE